jgi:hypothetical protein
MNGYGFGNRRATGCPSRRLARSAATLAVAVVMVSGCGDARRTFGLDHAPPDEFTVVKQAPLSMPPEFALRPPRPGAARPQDVAATQQAAASVFGGGGRSFAAGSSAGESALLQQAGAGNARSDIRAQIDAETRSLVVADRRWVDRLIFWQKQEPPYTVVNAQEEAKRLRENAAQGKAPTEGTTPTIERKRKAPLEGLFN